MGAEHTAKTCVNSFVPSVPDSSRQLTAWLLAAIFAVALLAQLLMWALGLYTTSADESARTLMADGLSLAAVLDPFIWPPLHKVIMGLGLYVHHDLFVTPRVIAQICGLVTLAALTRLAFVLFNSRTVAIVTAALSVFLNYRLFFAVVPMAETFFNLFVLLAATSFIGVVRSYRRSDLLLCAFWLGMASATRYEAWFFSAAFGLFLTYQCFFHGKLTVGTLISTGVVVSIFPLAWMLNAALYHGGIESLFAASVQAEAFDRSMMRVVLNSPLIKFSQDLLLSPMVVSLAGLASTSRLDSSLRTWATGILIAVVIITAAAIGTGSVAMATPWRMGGAATLVLVPFLAVWIVSFADTWRLGTRVVVICLATSVAVAGFGMRSTDLLKGYLSKPQFAREDLALGHHLRDWISDNDRRVLLESENYEFLHVLVAANGEDGIRLNTGDDVQRIALYLGQDEYWYKQDRVIYESYVKPKYGLIEGGDTQVIAKQNIGMIAVRRPEYIAALTASDHYVEHTRFGPWLVFEKKRAD